MSLYHLVADKDDLLDGMIDRRALSCCATGGQSG